MIFHVLFNNLIFDKFNLLIVRLHLTLEINYLIVSKNGQIHYHCFTSIFPSTKHASLSFLQMYNDWKYPHHNG